MTSPGAATRSEGRQVCAFFDFDKTLLHGDAGVIFGRSLGRYGYEKGGRFRTPVFRGAWNTYITLRITGALAQEAVFRSLYSVRALKRSKLVERGYRLLRGLPVEEMRPRMERLWDEVLAERLYPEMVDVVDGHRKQGHRVVIVTTGIRELVEHAKKRLGDDVEVIGVELLEKDGRWTGHVTGPLYGGHKRDILDAYARERGVDLEASYAYSDHFSDHPFLEAVGNPVAVNPKKRLEKLAERRGWKILRVAPPVRSG